MNSSIHWFVGASYGSGSEDQTERFLAEGIWENGFQNKHFDTVKSMKPGERIAIKSSYTRKKELPFDNKGNTVSVLGIKAVGTITENLNDGKVVKVDWEEHTEPAREWYFYTNRATIWRVTPDDWMRQGLIEFAFNGKKQDTDRFRNAPFWAERFGDKPKETQRFLWTQFYEELADRLLDHKHDRTKLIEFIHELPGKVESVSLLNDQPEEGNKQPLKDICPFTVFALFNRGITEPNRVAIATELASFLTLDSPVPKSFEGIPVVNNQGTWFFAYQYKRGTSDIDNLWSLFESALSYAKNSDNETLDQVAKGYDQALRQHGTGWNLSMGLYWIRPWKFLTLDGQSQKYIEKKLDIEIGRSGKGKRSSAKEYLSLIEDLEERFQEDSYPVHSFPELSLAAWAFEDTETAIHPGATDLVDVDEDDEIDFDEVSDAEKSVIPKFDELMIPFLRVIKDGKAHQSKQVYQTLKVELKMTEFDSVTVESTGKPLFDNRAAWAKSYLKKAGLVEFPARGEVQLTEDGMHFIGLPLSELARFKRFTDFFSIGESFTYEDESHLAPYTLENIVEDGCFLDVADLKSMLQHLRIKKNIILQGPPGTGKTWLAKKLAFALIGKKKESALKAVQFHPNLSYEDFVRGWRPSAEGKLELVNGPFIEMIDRAKKDAKTNHVVVIEEINRGNPAQIFGEMLTLLEADKRTPDEALELSYRKYEGEKVHIPANLFVVGTMNIADRSLALVDLALRRRFAFYDLKPVLNEAWKNWVHDKSKISKQLLSEIQTRISNLNSEIENDKNLGPQFKVGHSFVTPNVQIDDPHLWFTSVIESEIGPLLEEYWFDDIEKAQSATNALLLE